MISIVIPHWNRAGLLRETARSVAEQTLADWELILVDDGSAPEERRALDPLASDKVRLVDRREGPKGPSRCRNLGLEASRGEFVLFLDSDDLLAPWCLAQRLRAAEEYPEAEAWVFPVLLFRESPGDRDTLWNRMDGGDPVERFLRSDPPWHTSSPLWRRSALLELGGFNERIVYGDDADLHLRALLAGKRFHLAPEALPDAFIRRSDDERLTNRLTEDLLASRRIRLEEGSRLLEPASRERRRTWDGQYFHELEFLLFNLDHPHEETRRLLALWRKCGHTAPPLRTAASLYAATVLATRHRAYLLTRLARRAALALFPEPWFPRAGGFESNALDPKRYRMLRERIESPASSTEAARP